MAQSDVILLDSKIRRDLLPSSDEPAQWKRRFIMGFIVLLLIGLSLAVHYLTPIAWNVAVTKSLQSITIPGVRQAMVWISGFGNAPKLTLIAVLVMLACNKRREGFWLMFSGLGGWTLAMLLKPLFANPRPTNDLVNVLHQWNNGSFPSGHLVFYTCFFGFIFFIAREQMQRGSLLRRVVLAFSVALIALVGVSRTFVGEHWASDLPGSYLLGALWLMLSLKLYRSWQQAARKSHDWFLPYRLTDR